MRALKQILVPVDIVEENGFIIEYAKLLAEKLEAHITLFYARPPLDRFYDIYLTDPVVAKLQEDSKQQATAALEKIAQEHFSGTDVSIKIRRGQPQDVIHDLISTDEYDLVVMGTHCRRGVEKIFFGSVANRVVKYSNIPVLTIHPDECKV
ncbi:MAG: universal stress protein [Desulfovibrionales bacterium]|nr:universal stress protein [Desulfovibrionales bacterium]